jgi:hypothetical protein
MSYGQLMSEQLFYHLYMQNTILFISPQSLLRNTGQEEKSYVRKAMKVFLVKSNDSWTNRI